ncbi:pectate lyase family protein [Aestuariibaculum lutulentum]|uniref:T9SS type A sorting domain-containing protein n=1 Tax=Aestuariibaculum lutulentum TaxID=2920935 RepID=A0ABS9RF90_9FLAO|nr:T9SS type A sorting domain-containing protein [Aestuariibaculum lutulentum]MCH4551572.1 T9SS type A sorting domain-containing protein [Aestuariibaculum lutulentum]
MMKKLLFSLSLLLSVNLGFAQTVTIDESAGWLESAYLKWQPVTDAESYNVYFSGEGITDQKIDDQLIRNYGSYFRADILGLKAGSYTFKVAPVISGSEGTTTSTGVINVEAHDRTGFAFSNNRVPGAYKMDGTPKDNAVILYITENSKNTIELNVTGANSNPCVGLQTILDGFKKGNDTRPLIVRLIGQITDFDYMLNGDIVIENKQNASSHITFEGVGNDAVSDGWGIRVKNATNIEIRNIGSMNCNSSEGDNIGLQQDNDYIWVHNVDFFYGDAGGDADQAKGDGALDCKRSTYVTFSYNHFWDSGKSNLLGLSEDTTDGLYITYHHNWYDHSDSRHPRVRFYSAHVYNNYYDGNSKYGVGSTNGSSVFVEANYFRNCKYPMLTSMQGSDVYNSSTGTNDYANYPTFSKEDGGTIKAFNNYITGANRFVPYGDTNYPNPTVDFDAYVASTREESISNTVTSAYGTNTYNNFDTNTGVMYSYTPDTPEDAKTKVMQYSGRMHNGDFSWTFNNAVDDTSYDVNTALKSALTNYSSSLVSVQGETGPDPEIILTANAGDALVELSWQVNNYTASAYEIFRDTDSDPTGRVKITDINDANTLSYSDNTALNDVTYYYWVVADGNIESNSDSATPTEGGTVNAGEEVHNFTISGLVSTYYTIVGNLSTTKGTVNYNGLTLTQCLKIESATSITFTTNLAGTLTLVFNSDFSGRIKIDGVDYNATAGIVEITLQPGEHTISKTDVANLFYASYQTSSLGTAEFEANKFKLYPNPVDNLLYFSVNSKIEKIEIYNMLGMLVKTFKSTENNIDVNDLTSGSYLVKIYTELGTSDKIILKK